MEKLRKVRDPHIPLNIVDLGFIYEVKVDHDKVKIRMTLTNPMCPMSSSITRDVQQKIEEIEGVKEVKINLVFDPPWSPEMIDGEAKKRLGIE
jgi:metal-sulfur cluster biosynthetic enzyme